MNTFQNIQTNFPENAKDAGTISNGHSRPLAPTNPNIEFVIMLDAFLFYFKSWLKVLHNIFHHTKTTLITLPVQKYNNVQM